VPVARAVARLRAEDALSWQRTLEALVAGRQPGPPGTLADAPARPRPDRLAVRTGSRTVLVPVADVEWIESDGDYARLHVGGKVHLLSVRMHALEALLDPARFLRVHRSIIVCLAQVSELHRDDDGGGTAVLRSGVRLRVARSRWEDLERALAIG
jgi:two-component system, LytTR family, response regulator